MKLFDHLRLPRAIRLPKPSVPDRRAEAVNVPDTIARALSSTSLGTGAIKGVAETIGQALAAAGLSPRDQAGPAATVAARSAGGTPAQNQRDAHGKPPADLAQAGEFVSRVYANAAGTRAYKLYVPTSYSPAGPPVPMLVMLHGCTQSPDDFAAGTRMNALAEQHGFLVVYPAQAANANGSKCWNWFRAEDQQRDHGEPSLIAGITREVAAHYRVDDRRIFVAGLSAGAAMAVILGATYPDLYAAVGAHSGLPYGAAHDMPSAFGAMKGSSPLVSALKQSAGRNSPARHAVPTIVFHGDRDHTVDARNGTAIVEQATAARAGPSLRVSVRDGSAPGGRTYRQTVHADAAEQPMIEQWVLHGGGHAWSGGSPDGSFTDAGGPDASAEMIRFFYMQRRAGATY